MENPYAPQPQPVRPSPGQPDSFLLVNAPEEYRRTVARGLSFILNGILLAIIVGLLSVGVNLALQGQPAVQIGCMLLQLAVSVLTLVGYWLYSIPDPGQDALAQIGSARRWVRVAIAVQIVIQAAQVVVLTISPPVAPQPGQMPVFTAGMLVGVGLGLVSLLLAAAQFVAVMFYTRELALRIPDAYIIRRTMIYAWMLPLIAIVGIIACGLGPLVALVFYWNLLDRLRKQMKSINTAGVPADLPGTLG